MVVKKKLVKTINLNEEATTVASPRSRAGQKAQEEFIERMERLVAGLEKTLNNKNIQLEVEPNANTLINNTNKKDKKKLN